MTRYDVRRAGWYLWFGGWLMLIAGVGLLSLRLGCAGIVMVVVAILTVAMPVAEQPEDDSRPTPEPPAK